MSKDLEANSEFRIKYPRGEFRTIFNRPNFYACRNIDVHWMKNHEELEGMRNKVNGKIKKELLKN